MDISQILRFIRHTVEDGGEEFMATMFVESGVNGPDGIVQLDRFPKEAWPQVMQAVATKLNAPQYVFVSESWAAMLPPDSPLMARLLKGKIRVSELPPDDRTEILNMLIVPRFGEHEMRMAKIKRLPSGKRVIEPWEIFRGAKRFESRLVVKW